MRKVCAWCNKNLGSPNIDMDFEDTPVTHGICGDCARAVLSFKAKQLQSFLDRFQEPVFLVTSEGRIVTANTAGLSALSKKPEEVDGKLGGEAFDCRYADLPGGCGQTVHCKTCTIRNTVMDTLESGKSHLKVAAYPDLHHITGDYRIRFLITTERVGDAVLLRIDDTSQEAVGHGFTAEEEKSLR